MSLLMDALKKAEQAKRGSQNGAYDDEHIKPSPALELAPLDGALAAMPVRESTSLAESPAQLANLDEEFQTPPARTPLSKNTGSPEAAAPDAAHHGQDPRRPKPRQVAAPGENKAANGERAAAQNVVPVSQTSGASNKLFPIAVGTVSLIAVAVIGLYFWMQLRPGSTGPLLQTATLPPPAQPATATNATIAPIEDPIATARRRSANPRPTTDSPHAAVVQPASSALGGSDDPIRITTASLQVNPTLLRGYEAFAAGRLGESRSEYEQLLKSEPKNGEALLGMATISLRFAQPSQAETFYLRAIEADPKDALAQVGLIALRGQADPIQSESRLKNLLAAQPTSPALNLALGNLYAAQGRWNEAQQAYFIAYTGAGEDPDIVFNLAVSLDHLQQPALAAQYYKQALDASTSRQAGFDPAQVSARLRDLSH